MNLNKYIIKKLLTDFIIINFVINGIFYVVNFKNFSGQLTIGAIAGDLMFGLVMLGILCSLIGFINIPKDLKKGQVSVVNYQGFKLGNYIPENIFLRVLILAVATVGIVFPLFTVLPWLCGVSQINHLVGFGIKTLSASLAALMIGLVVLDVSLKEYQKISLNE